MGGQHSGTSVYCDCHHTERLMDIKPHLGFEIIDDRHGIKHKALVPPREALERLAGTLDGSAIVDYVRRVMA